MTCNRLIRYHAAQSEIIYYVMCALFEFFQDSVHSLSLGCAIELNVYSNWALFRTDKISDLYYYQSAILSRSNKRRFCLVRKIGDFVSFSESAILSHFQNRQFCPTLKTARFCLASIFSMQHKKSECSRHISIFAKFCSRQHCPCTFPNITSIKIFSFW